MKSPSMAACLALAVAAVIVVDAQQPAQVPSTDRPFRIVKDDPGLDDIIDTNAKLELVAEHIGLSEGPLWIQEGQSGYLLFTDVAANVIYKRTPAGQLSVFLENAGYTGVVKSNGAVYFSDTVNGIRGGATGPSRELPFNGFYLVKDGAITYLGGDRDQGTGAPNGLTLSPDEKYLYVSSGGRVDGATRLPATVWRYEIRPDDTVTNGRVFIPDGGSDGMKVDRRGNLYTTAGGGGTPIVRITSPDGKPLGRLELPYETKEPRPRICATNVAFGDPDNRGLYITACSNVYRLRLKAPGVIPGKAVT